MRIEWHAGGGLFFGTDEWGVKLWLPWVQWYWWPLYKHMELSASNVVECHLILFGPLEVIW